MTTNTNAVLAQLRHLYANMMGGEVRDTAQTKRMAQGLLAPAIEALEQAALTTAAAVPPEGVDDSAPGLSDLAAHLRGECQDATDCGDGFLNVTRVLEIVNQYHGANCSTRCEWCKKMVRDADAGPPCATRSEADRCDAMLAAAPKAEPAPAAGTHIQQPYTLAEIKAKIASNDYSAELLLQHAMLLLEKPADVAPQVQPVLCVSSKAFARMKAGDDSIKAWLPPATSVEDMLLYAASPPTQASHQPAVQQGDGGTDIGPLGQRTILDAIRSAYDLGYNDARNARTHPGDSAPGYKGRNVEKDHGGALIARLNVLATKPQPAVPARDAT